MIKKRREIRPPASEFLINALIPVCSHLSPAQLQAEIEELFFDQIIDEESQLISINLAALPPRHAEAMLRGLLMAAAQNGMSTGMPFLDHLPDRVEEIIPMQHFIAILITKHMMAKIDSIAPSRLRTQESDSYRIHNQADPTHHPEKSQENSTFEFRSSCRG